MALLWRNRISLGYQTGYCASYRKPANSLQLARSAFTTDRSNEPISKEEFFALGMPQTRVDCVTSALAGAGDVIGLNRGEAGHRLGKPERAELGPENPLASTLNQGVMGSNPIGHTKSSENSRMRTSWAGDPLPA